MKNPPTFLLYIDELKTLEDIASILGVSKSKVYSIIKDNNIKMTKEQKHKKYSNAGGRAEIFTKEELIDLYINKNNSLNDIITKSNDNICTSCNS